MLQALVAAVLLNLASAAEPNFCSEDDAPKILSFKLEGAIEDSTADFVEAAIQNAVDYGMRAVVLEINSPGGSLLSAKRAFDAINLSPVPVHCFVDKLAGSGAAWILQACQVRVVSARAFVAIHRPSWDAPAQILTETTLRVVAEGLRTFRHEMFADIARRMRRPESDIDAATTGEINWVLRGERAVTEGAADRVGTLDGLWTSLGAAR